MRRLFIFTLLSALAACSEPARENEGASTGAETPVLPPGDPGSDEAEPENDPPGADQPEQREENLVVGEDRCTSDADCVPAACCHAAACVAADNAPSCEGMMCTMDCRYGTIDCGGGCLCHEGRCAARLSEAPEAVQEIQ